MNALLHFLIDHGLTLLTGTTALLTLGALFMLCQRSPVHRQRIGETTLLATLAWLLLTCIPLPRLSLKLDAPTIVRPQPPIPASAIATGEHTEPPLPAIEAPQAPALFDDTTIAGFIQPEPESAPPTFPAITPPPPPLDWPRFAARAYLLGLAAAAAWILLGHILLRRLVRSAHAPAPWLADLFQELSAPAKSRLLISPTASRPISCGLLRPTIILPQPCASRDRIQQLRQVLRHELAHVAQRDSLGHALFNLALPVLYFHPLYWLIRAKTFLARELVADDRAAAATSKESYVSELIALAAQRLTPHAAARLNVIGIFESTTHFYRRMHMLLQRQTPLATRCSTPWRCFTAATALAILGCSTLFIGVDSAHAQSATQDQNREIAALTAQRDDLAAKLAQMELQLNQLRAQMEALRAQGLQQQMDEMRIRAASDRKAPETVNRARVAESRKTTSTEAIRRRSELQRQQAKEELEQLAGEAGGNITPLDPPPGGRNTSTARGQSSQFDLISLANSYIEASGNRKLLQLKLARLQEIVKNNVGSQEELDAAAIGLEMAERKVRLFRGMAEAALRAAEGDYKHARELVEKGFAPASAIHDAESRLQVLKLILEN